MAQHPLSSSETRASSYFAACSAVLGVVLLSVAVLQGVGFRGYDLYTHLFFASHYLNDWWSTWDPRWYGGFDLVSYPPLAHYLLAVMVRALGPVGGAKLFSLLLVVGFPIAVWRFARIFVETQAAVIAAGVALLMPAFGLLLIADGQLPGLLSLEILLAAAGEANDYLLSGKRPRLAAFALGVAAAAAAHHATPVLFGPFVGLAVAATQRLFVSVWRRVAALAAVGGLAVLIVIWPFWRWWLTRPVQTPIDHLSRHSIVNDPSALVFNLVLPYSVWLLLLPVALVFAVRRKTVGLAVAMVAVFVLSLGGTTPLPSWLYGSSWAWLTFERYTLWCGVLLLPLAGWAVLQLIRRCAPGVAVLLLTVLTAVSAGSTAVAAWHDVIRPVEPQPVDPQPVVDFLAASGRDRWRYLTLGLGDQLAEVGAMSSARSIDGDYNTARRDPVLLSSGIDKLDSIRYWDPSVAALKTYLLDPARTHLRWVLANESYYDDVLSSAGWRRVQILSNGIVVWSPLVVPPPLGKEDSVGPTVASVWWGSVPLIAAAGFLACAIGPWLSKRQLAGQLTPSHRRLHAWQH